MLCLVHEPGHHCINIIINIKISLKSRNNFPGVRRSGDNLINNTTCSCIRDFNLGKKINSPITNLASPWQLIVYCCLQKWVPQDGELHLGGGLDDNMRVVIFFVVVVHSRAKSRVLWFNLACAQTYPISLLPREKNTIRNRVLQVSIIRGEQGNRIRLRAGQI